MILPDYISDIINSLELNGHEAFVVGGCTRDYLLGLQPKDWDITTDAPPQEVMRIFQKTIPTGLKHGTVTVLYNSNPVEITTYRTETTYSDGRHPDNVSFTSSLYEDLSRRDFTMNAIAYSPNKGFIDFFDGIKSINERKIYCVGNSHKRFSEDALRMMRAIRFSTALNFSLDQSIIEAIIANRDLLRKISAERIRDEFVKSLLSQHTEKIYLYKETGLLDIFLPELSEIPDDILKSIFAKICRIPDNLLSARIASLLSTLDDVNVSNTLKRMHFDNNTIKSVTNIVQNIHIQNISGASIRKIASRIGSDNLSNLIYTWEALDMLDKSSLASTRNFYNEIIEKNICLNINDLKINGNVIKALGISDGEKIGTILRFLLDEVLIDPSLNNEQDLITIVKQNY